MNFDFATILVLLVVISGAIWAVDAMILAPRRRFTSVATEDGQAPNMGPMAKIADYARSFFPVFFIVLILRSFLVEPFRIPSGSMLPTLEIGDFILVNKYNYGIRLPILDKKIVDTGQPKRGDVIVFRFPEDRVTPYIKRVVGLPGDRIDYRNDTLFINGTPVSREFVETYTAVGSARKMTGARRYLERLEEVDHHTLIRPIHLEMLGTNMYPHVPTKVPNGHYFVMGDNRDNSRDSRFWGLVPDENLIGRAFLIWMNLDWGEGMSWPSWSRIGNPIQ